MAPADDSREEQRHQQQRQEEKSEELGKPELVTDVRDDMKPIVGEGKAAATQRKMGVDKKEVEPVEEEPRGGCQRGHVPVR